MGILGFLGILAAALFLGGAGSFSGNMGGKYQLNPPKGPASSCKASIEPDKLMRVDVSPEKEGFYSEKEEKLWVLIKKDAYIPSWKVEAEMTLIGKTVLPFSDDPENPLNQNPDVPDKTVYIGTGHCRGNPNSDMQGCKDPLVQDVLFVVRKEGEESHRQIGSEKDPKKWWEFNVYLDRSLLPADPKFKDLPCWAKMACASGDINGTRRDEFWQKFLRTGVCEVDEQTDEGGFSFSLTADNGSPKPSFVLEKDIKRDPGFSEELSEVYWFDSELDTHPRDLGFLLAGDFVYGEENYKAYYDPAGGTITLVLLPGEKQFFMYVPIGKTKRPADGNRSLQLGTFYPKVERKFSYEWWTPACKPAIYLYPEKQTKVNVRVEPEGELTKTIPEYSEEGWNVIAEPNGTIVQNNSEQLSYSEFSETYPYLFYEADIKNINFPDKGWVVAREDLSEFFSKKLRRLGLNKKEIGDFKKYWVKKLSDSPYYFIGLLDKRELNRLEKITISPAPDTFIRVRFVFEKLYWPISIEPPSLPERTERKGFTSVDWGGILVGGSCGEGKSF